MAQPEPWLRGTHRGTHAVAAHLHYTFEQAREELPHHCGGLAGQAIWHKPHADVAPVGFHLRHIAGSVDRLTTYLRGEQLNEAQLLALHREHAAGSSFLELMETIEVEFERTEALVASIEPPLYGALRVVGRKQLETTIGGLIVHISEHTQRHLGQAVLTAKLVRGLDCLHAEE